MNYYATVQASACITKKKSRLKVYDSKNVYLNDGDNFEIELYNPETDSVLAKIKINGEYISQSGVVLKPGQRIFLERFLDTNNKFVYNTYKVKDNRQNRDAIAFNGDISIEFYQKIKIGYNYLSGGSWGNGWSYINTTTTPYFNTNINGTYTTSSVSVSNPSNNPSLTIETGRVEMGKKSKQEFSSSNESFSSVCYLISNFKILPINTKNITTKDLKQYCTECGKKIKKEYKFCPSCGNKV